MQEILTQSSYLNLLYALNIDSSSFMEKAREMLTRICSWAKRYLKDAPQPSDDVIDFNFESEANVESEARLALPSVADIEENILCPSLGLKGKPLYLYHRGEINMLLVYKMR